MSATIFGARQPTRQPTGQSTGPRAEADEEAAEAKANDEADEAEAEAAQALLAMRDADLIAALVETEMPILLIHGSEDKVVPLGNSRRLAQLLGRRATLVELEGAGHCPQEEVADRVAEEIDRFLSARGLLK